MSSDFSKKDRIKVLEGVYKDRKGTVEVLVPITDFEDLAADVEPKNIGVKIDSEKGDKMLMPLVWFEPKQIEREVK